MGTYVIQKNGNKENLNFKAVTMINPITGWSKIAEYNNKYKRKIVNSVETTWLTRYPWPTEIMYDQVSAFYW